MAAEPGADAWNADAINRGWSLWRELVEADDARRAIGALLKDDLRCIVLAQVLEERQAVLPPIGRVTARAAPGSGRKEDRCTSALGRC